MLRFFYWEGDLHATMHLAATVTPDAKLKKAYEPIFERWEETLEGTF